MESRCPREKTLRSGSGYLDYLPADCNVQLATHEYSAHCSPAVRRAFASARGNTAMRPFAKLLFPLVCVCQETTQLLHDIVKLSTSEESDGNKTRLMGAVFKCDEIELIQSVWGRCVKEELLHKDDQALPPHLRALISVKHTSIYLFFTDAT